MVNMQKNTQVIRKNSSRIRILEPRIFLVGLLLAGAVLFTATAARSADETSDIAPLDPLAMKLAPGEWREYRFTGGATEGTTVRWTWLETVEQEDGSYQWFETTMNQNGQALVSRILGSVDDPAAPLIRVIIQTADMPPREMPEEMRLMAAPALKRNTLNPPTKLPEAKSVEVPAGTYTTTVYESNISGAVNRTYYSETLPGMILFENDAGGMELVAFGNDGTTAIDGEIVPYTPLPPGVKPGAAARQMD
jgi:hypothetical protein